MNKLEELRLAYTTARDTGADRATRRATYAAYKTELQKDGYHD